MERRTRYPVADRVLRCYAVGGACWTVVAALTLGAVSWSPLHRALLVLAGGLSFVALSHRLLSVLLYRDLDAQQDLFQATFDHAAVGIAHVAPNGAWLRVNRTFCGLIGYTPEELVSLSVREITHPDDLSQTEHSLHQLLLGRQQHYRIEKRYLHKEGHPVWAALSVSPVHGADGKISFLIAVIQDITARKEAEEALAQYREHLEEIVAERSAKLARSELSLNEAQHISHIGNWELEIPSGTLTWSEELYRILELDPGTPPSFDSFLVLHPPADRQKVQEAYAESVQTGVPYDLEHRLVFPDGRVKQLHEHCHTYYDAAGRPQRSVGTLQDVSSHWETEERLRQFSRVVEQSPVSVVITDLQGKIIYVNPRFSQLTGYAPDEVIGGSPRILQTPHTPRETYREMWQALAANREWHGEFCNRKKDGSLYWERAYIGTVTNAQGEPTHFVAVKEDITEQKETEAKLTELSLADALTGLSNRRSFMILAEQQVKVSDRKGNGFLLVYADIDGMKWINDTLGHAEGDRALRDVAVVLRACFRSSDVVARLGGDEFVAMSLEASEGSAESIRERLGAVLLAHNHTAGRPYLLSLSFGITRYDPAEPCSVEDLLERGDRLMYQVKRERQQGERTRMKEGAAMVSDITGCPR